MLGKTLKQKRDAEERLRANAAQVVYTETSGGDQVLVDPSDALTVAVESLNALTGAVTIAVSGGITISVAGQTITIDGTEANKYYEPLTDRVVDGPSLLFADGDVLMGEVS